MQTRLTSVVRFLADVVRRQTAVFALFLVLSLLFAWLNRFNTSEAMTFIGHHVRMMHYYLGDPSVQYSLYPLWGYPLVLTVVQWAAGSYEPIIYLQAVAGACILIVVLRFFAERLRSNGGKAALLVLLTTALPFYGVIASRWPAAFQLIFIVLSVLLLIRAFEQGSLRDAVLAGLSLGAAANFRSEYVYFSLYLVIFWECAVLLRVARTSAKRRRILLLYLLATWVALVPLGLERLAKTGQFNVFAGNGNWVNVYFSVGQLPGNSLGVRFDDAFVEQYLREWLDPATYDTTLLAHQQPAANAFCRAKFIEYASSHPGELVLKGLWNVKQILVGGFFIGHPEQALPDRAYYSTVLVREFGKKLVGLPLHEGNLAELAQRHLIETSGTVRFSDLGFTEWMIGFPFLALIAVFPVIFWVTLGMSAVVTFRAWRSRTALEPRVLLPLAFVKFACIMMMLGVYQNRFSSMFYLFLVMAASAFLDLSARRQR
jgi:hypothetical protein